MTEHIESVLALRVQHVAALLAAVSLAACASLAPGADPAGDLPAARVFADVAASVVSLTVVQGEGLDPEFAERLRRSAQPQCAADLAVCPDPLEDTVFEIGAASGFFIDDSGRVLTAAHAVAQATRIHARTGGGEVLQMEVEGADAASDVAVLRPVQPVASPPVRLGDSRRLRIGDRVLAIGSPFGFERSLAAGLVSGRDRRLGSSQQVPFLQTDVTMNPGNSGGPLFDARGRVVAMNTRIVSPLGGFSGVSFAVPIELAMLVAGDLIAGRPVLRGKIGGHLIDPPPAILEVLGLPMVAGAMVSAVEARGALARAGLVPGDLIDEIDGVPVRSAGELGRRLFELETGAMATIRYRRGTAAASTRFSYAPPPAAAVSPAR